MMNENKLQLEWLPGRYAICRLKPHDPIPLWAGESVPSLLSITRTDRELSIVIDESLVADGVQAQRGYAAMRIKGTLDFACVGILAKLTGALAAANIPVFVISTFETDVILVPAEFADKSWDALAVC